MTEPSCTDLNRLGNLARARRADQAVVAPYASRSTPRNSPMVGPPKPRRLDEPIAESLEDRVP
jgi:hypothetical protein